MFDEHYEAGQTSRVRMSPNELTHRLS